MSLQTEFLVLFLLILCIVSFLFSAVGHGGASGYLAAMALFSFTPEVMKPTALVLNLVVSAIAFFQFCSRGYFRKKLFLMLIIGSVPLAFLGGYIDPGADLYKRILVLCLLFAAIRLIISVDRKEEDQKIPGWTATLVTGASIGFVSGLIGIGGGIILSPVIVLFRWGTVKQAAAISALFIWFNSAAGLSGQFLAGVSPDPATWMFILVVLAGGILGSYFGVIRFKEITLRYLLVAVLLLACFKLTFL